MAKYSKKAGKKVEKAMHEKKSGTLKSGRSGKKVKSRKQAIAIGLSEARKAGGKSSEKEKRSQKEVRPQEKKRIKKEIRSQKEKILTLLTLAG